MQISNKAPGGGQAPEGSHRISVSSWREIRIPMPFRGLVLAVSPHCLAAQLPIEPCTDAPAGRGGRSLYPSPEPRLVSPSRELPREGQAPIPCLFRSAGVSRAGVAGPAPGGRCGWSGGEAAQAIRSRRFARPQAPCPQPQESLTWQDCPWERRSTWADEFIIFPARAVLFLCTAPRRRDRHRRVFHRGPASRPGSSSPSSLAGCGT